MDERIWIYLIIGFVIVTVLYMFRRTLKRFLFKAGANGVEAQLEAHDQNSLSGENNPAQSRRSKPSVNITRNWQIGRRNKIDVGHGQANVEKNKQIGSDQEINAKPDTLTKK